MALGFGPYDDELAKRYKYIVVYLLLFIHLWFNDLSIILFIHSNVLFIYC